MEHAKINDRLMILWLLFQFDPMISIDNVLWQRA